jgi:DNA glycosylase AlkZ-like
VIVAAGRARLTALRLAAQGLAAASAASPGEVVGSMLAMQGQDLPGVRWSVGVRLRDGTDAAVTAALDAGELVRSWPMRGTLHLVRAADLHWMLDLTAARALASVAPRRAVLGITEARAERARDIAVEALPGRRTMTRAALLGAIEAGGVSTAGQRGYHLLWYLAQTGTLVLGPSDGRQQTFVRLDAWVPEPRRLDRAAALGELALRYFRSHGPATVADLARWSGLPVSEVRRGLDACGAGLATIEVDGRTYHLAPETLDRPAVQPGHVILLPGFDEYLLGYGDRSAALAPEHSEAIVPGGNGMFKATIVADGAVVGTWSRKVTAHEVLVEAAPFLPLPPAAVEGIETAAAAYGQFLGRTARIRTQAPE